MQLEKYTNNIKMATIIKGDELMLFKNEKSLAFATAHTLTISGSTIDISSKDHGYWGASEIGNITWEITSENLYTDADYDALFNSMINKEKVTVKFGHASNYDVNGLGELPNWSPATTGLYTGDAFITSLTANANTGENATFSVTLSGAGALKKVS